MSRRAALIVTATSSEPPELVAARVGRLAERGWDPLLLCRGDRWADDPHVHALAGRAHFNTASNEAIGPFDEELLALRPSVVHFHSAWGAYKALGALRRLDCALVVSLREDGRDLEIPDPGAVAARCDLLLCPSRALLERAIDRGWPAERAEVLELPPGEVAGRPPPREPPSGGPLRLLSFGPLVWEHGLEHAIHGVALARDRGADLRLRVVGAGDHLHAVAFARHQLGMTEHVEIVRSDHARPLADELADADVLVDSAVTDTLPQTPLAAAQELGVPYVATRREGPSPERGLFVGRRDPHAIADALVRLATQPGLHHELADAGPRELARLLEEHLTQLEELYLRVVGQSAAESVTSAAT
jgi:glycosyltransferase involved in cell wall biosynthesis